MTHKGFRVTARNILTQGVRGLDVRIDGHVFTIRADRDRPAALADAARYIDDSLKRRQAYTWTRELTFRQLRRRQAF